MEIENLKEKFFRYEWLRNEGIYNMLMEAEDASSTIGIQFDEYMWILKHYTELADKYLLTKNDGTWLLLR